MSQVLANGKKAKLLQQEVAYLNTLVWRLYKNNLVPAGTNVIGDFVEVTDTGYAPGGAGTGGVTPVFGPATLNGAFQAQTVAPQIVWTFTFSGGSFTVYGYYATDPVDGAVVLSERAGSPLLVTASGQIFTLTPKKLMDTM